MGSFLVYRYIIISTNINFIQIFQRWVYCFRQCLLNISINTTNGVERMHKLLKEKYLKESGFGGTLTSLLTVLVKRFFPEMQAK